MTVSIGEMRALIKCAEARWSEFAGEVKRQESAKGGKLQIGAVAKQPKTAGKQKPKTAGKKTGKTNVSDPPKKS